MDKYHFFSFCSSLISILRTEVHTHTRILPSYQIYRLLPLAKNPLLNVGARGVPAFLAVPRKPRNTQPTSSLPPSQQQNKILRSRSRCHNDERFLYPQTRSRTLSQSCRLPFLADASTKVRIRTNTFQVTPSWRKLDGEGLDRYTLAQCAWQSPNVSNYNHRQDIVAESLMRITSDLLVVAHPPRALPHLNSEPPPSTSQA